MNLLLFQPLTWKQVILAQLVERKTLMIQETLDFNKIIDPPCPPASIDHVMPNNPKCENLRRKTEKWLSENPRIYDLFRKYSLELLKKGRKFSISLITERIRWECYFEYDTDFKISNDCRAYIARKLCEEIPELQAVFRFRKTRWWGRILLLYRQNAL